MLYFLQLALASVNRSPCREQKHQLQDDVSLVHDL